MLICWGEEDKLDAARSRAQALRRVGSKDKTSKSSRAKTAALEHCQVDNRQVGTDYIADWLTARCCAAQALKRVTLVCYWLHWVRCSRRAVRSAAGLSAAADPHGGAVSRRRLDRRHRPRDCAALERGAGPADRHRQPRRRRRHARHRARRQGGSPTATRSCTAIRVRSRSGHCSTASLGYDLFRDLAPVSQSVSSPFMVFATHRCRRTTQSQKLIAYAKERPGQLNYASSGVGSGLHLVGELFKSVDRHETRPRSVQRHQPGAAGTLRRPRATRDEHSRGPGAACQGRRMKGIVSTGTRTFAATSRKCRPASRPRCPAFASVRGMRSSPPLARRGRSVNKLQQTLTTTWRIGAARTTACARRRYRRCERPG